jgi:hypothetical protein
MAKVLEQVLAIKLSKIVRNNDEQTSVASSDQISALLSSIPELAEGILDDSSIVVEVMELE